MAEVYGYLLNKEQRDAIKYNQASPARIFVYSDEKYAYNDKAKKIAMLLILSDSVKRVNFEIEERRLFEELGRIAYENIDRKIEDMQIFGSRVLLEQAIIAIVSNWETYFSSILKRILDDDAFIKKKLDDKDKFKRFLRDFRLAADFQQEVLLNKNKFIGLNFGSFIIENRKINFQDLKALKKLFKLLFGDINIVNISRNWNEIDKLFTARHILVHNSSDSIENESKFRRELNAGKRRVSDVYTKRKVEAIMKDMAKITDKIDMELFEKLDTNYLSAKN